MATIIEKKLLEALYDVKESIQNITIQTDNTDVVSAITNINFDSSEIVNAIEGMKNGKTNLDIVQTVQNKTHTDIVTAIQNKTHADVVSAIQAQTFAAITAKLDTLIAAINAKLAILKSSSVTFREIVSASIPAGTPVKLMDANPNRVGFVITNNSTNSLYVGPTNPPSGAKQFFQLASNAGPTCMVQCFGPLIWTGELWCLRNSGTGGVTGYEFQ